MKQNVVFHPHARQDLLNLYTYIRDRSGARVAKSYVDRIRDACLDLATFPERGTSHPDLGPGVRIVGFEGRVSIAFSVQQAHVVILGVFYAGRSIRLPAP